MANILIIDDDPNSLTINKDILEHFHHQVQVVSTLGEANTSIIETKIDLVMLDVLLPDGNGLSLIPSLDHYTIPYFVTSALSQKDLLRYIEQQSVIVKDYLLKPFTVTTLIQKVSEHIDSKVPI
ncbi:MAG: response regulator [Vampirovibrio sp.]|nr:response regulator [Vampirovibrio sp.]